MDYGELSSKLSNASSEADGVVLHPRTAQNLRTSMAAMPNAGNNPDLNIYESTSIDQDDFRIVKHLD